MMLVRRAVGILRERKEKRRWVRLWLARKAKKSKCMRGLNEKNLRLRHVLLPPATFDKIEYKLRARRHSGEGGDLLSD